MSIARRLAKCRRDCLRCAGQTSPPVQRATASSTSRITADPHSGHFSFTGLAHATKSLQAGQTLYVFPGTYAEPLIVEKDLDRGMTLSSLEFDVSRLARARRVRSTSSARTPW